MVLSLKHNFTWQVFFWLHIRIFLFWKFGEGFSIFKVCKLKFPSKWAKVRSSDLAAWITQKLIVVVQTWVWNTAISKINLGVLYKPSSAFFKVKRHQLLSMHVFEMLFPQPYKLFWHDHNFLRQLVWSRCCKKKNMCPCSKVRSSSDHWND